MLEDNNSEVIELSTSQAVVLNALFLNEATVLPLEEVEPEIAVIIRTEMEREAVQNISDQLMTNIENDEPFEQLLAGNGIEWLTEEDVNRDSGTVNREILAQVFSMSLADSDTPAYDSLTLNNDTAVILELNSINAGSIASIPQIDQENMLSSMISDLGNSDFQAYMSNLQENADIESSILDEKPL